MSEKPYPKPEDGAVLVFKGQGTQDGPDVGASRWVGTDLARFAQDVVALNSRSKEKGAEPRCQVAPLESMQRGLKIKKPAEEPAPSPQTVDLSRFR
jgi:hypothetical protein